MKDVYVCVPVLKRYDCLWEFIRSCELGTIKPTRYIIIDNGNKLMTTELIPPEDITRLTITGAGQNIGVAKAWNYFMIHVPEVRIIANDDLLFYPDTIELLMNDLDENMLTYPAGTGSFSCFILNDKIIENVGYFDEDISPNYGYYEDNDYHRRMLAKGFDIRPTEGCRTTHVNNGSNTLKAYTPEEMAEHHIKFHRATINYVRKWGGPPHHELYETPFNE